MIGAHHAGSVRRAFRRFHRQTGRHGSPNDVARAGLRLLKKHEAEVKALQDALIAGEESGLKRMRAKHAREAGRFPALSRGGMGDRCCHRNLWTLANVCSLPPPGCATRAD
ncbi:MAG: type II toxin-antitoxin system ParD family antitoxin [Alphaproteobacteria bacterium]|nr:type II toxin-antitoxin system ParD family antitoxin [Alphaproteobacteria bacterium]